MTNTQKAFKDIAEIAESENSTRESLFNSLSDIAAIARANEREVAKQSANVSHTALLKACKSALYCIEMEVANGEEGWAQTAADLKAAIDQTEGGL